MIEDKKYFIYVLYSENFNKIYRWTIKFRPWKLIYSEEVSENKKHQTRNAKRQMISEVSATDTHPVL